MTRWSKRELACQIADRQPAPPRVGREKIVARKMRFDRLLPIRAIDNEVHEPKRALASDLAAEPGFENFMIDGGEIAKNVGAQDMGVVIAVALIKPDGFVGSFTGAVCEDVIREARLEQRADNGAKRVMDDAVAKRGGGNEPLFWIFNEDFDISPGTIRPVRQFTLKPQNFAFEVRHECRRARLLALAVDGYPGRCAERSKTRDALRKAIMPFRQGDISCPLR